VGAALRFVELEERKNSIVATLSGGMRTRVSLACAVVHRPALMLLDEPTVGVDPSSGDGSGISSGRWPPRARRSWSPAT